MLVLNRRHGEQIYVAGPCLITLVDSGSSRAKIGINAIKDVNIARWEIMKTEAVGEALEKCGLLQDTHIHLVTTALQSEPPSPADNRNKPFGERQQLVPPGQHKDDREPN